MHMMDALGDKIDLNGFTGFRGGLDTKRTGDDDDDGDVEYKYDV